jgi:WD40 repeat protein
MTKHDEPFQPEKIEEQIDHLLAQVVSHAADTVEPEGLLIHDLHLIHADNTPSGERVWARLAERLEGHHAASPRLHVLTYQPSSKERKSKSMHTPELNTIQSQPVTLPRKSRRVFALVAAVLIATLLVGSALWTLTAIRAPQQNTRTAQGGTPNGISAGKLLCHISYNGDSGFEQAPPSLSWSADGTIAIANPFLKIVSGQTCTSQSLINLPNTFVRPVWSPDGQRLLLLHGNVAEVRDARTGTLLFHFQAAPSFQFTQAVWAPGSTQIISSSVNVLSHTTESVKVQIWDANSGTSIRTAFSFDDGVLIGSAWISPGGQYLATQGSEHTITFWNVGTGKRISTTTSSVAGNAQPVAWSPDGASLAIGLPNANWPSTPSQVQIWSSATGRLTATFQDSNTTEGTIGGLAWSPDGKYLAESSAAIHIWDRATGQLVATFGKVAAQTTPNSGKATTLTQIVSVSWASNGRQLASLTTSVIAPLGGLNSQNQQNTLNVWQLL